MPPSYDHIPDDIKKEALNASRTSSGKNGKGDKNGSGKNNKEEKEKITGAEKKQHRIFKRKRAGVVLSKDEVKEIKIGRKKLRREMKARGIKSKREFELTAGALGLYFDKRHGFLFWLLGHWFWALLGALLMLLLVLFIFSIITQLRGHFTINLSDGMFREGFTLSDSIGFENPTTALFANPAENVPAVSITQIPADVDSIDGEHNDVYFAYTYYIRNEGDNSVGYNWSLDLNSESKNLSKGCWVMLFEDGKMRFYAKANEKTGDAEALPPIGDDSRGYLSFPTMELAPESEQFELIRNVSGISYYRVIPDKFISDIQITTGTQSGVEPMEVHKYTVVLWLEGDDIDTTDELINGHMGVEMNFRLVREQQEQPSKWNSFWQSLKFWE